MGKIAVFGGNLAEWPFSLSCNCSLSYDVREVCVDIDDVALI